MTLLVAWHDYAGEPGHGRAVGQDLVYTWVKDASPCQTDGEPFWSYAKYSFYILLLIEAPKGGGEVDPPPLSIFSFKKKK